MLKPLDEVRQLARLRHYNYRTEKAYMLPLLLRITGYGVFKGCS